jgi:hypothetical protein
MVAMGCGAMAAAWCDGLRCPAEVYAFSQLQGRSEIAAKVADSAAAEMESSAVQLTVQGFGGGQIASFRCSVRDTIYEVKQRLLKLSGDGADSLQLVQGARVLQDTDRLSVCAKRSRDGKESELTFTCVRVALSSLATLADSALGDVTDSALRHEYTLAERLRPRAEEVTKVLPRELRGKLISWMIASFDVLEFDPELLYGTVLTLDRYCAAMAAPLDQGAVGLALLAAICTEMKISSHDKFPFGQLQRLLRHLCQNRFEVPEILRTERKMLQTLCFEVGSPTSFTFFEALQMRLRITSPEEEHETWLDLAEMLLRLALLDPQLQYGYSHTILAASAISAALSVCGAPAARRAELLEDLSAYRLDKPCEQTVFDCERELLLVWEGSLCRTGEWSQFYPSVYAAFDTPQRHNVARRYTPAQRLLELDGLRQMDSGRVCKPF